MNKKGLRYIDLEKFKEACIDLHDEILRHNENIKYSGKQYRYFKHEIHLLRTEEKQASEAKTSNGRELCPITNSTNN